MGANKLTLNTTKTEFMLIASRQKLSQFMKSPSLTINENAVEQVVSVKSVGVYTDQNINWECNIENISKKIACAIGAIKRIRHPTPFNILIKVYNSLVQPHSDYCNVVWETATRAFLNNSKGFRIAQLAPLSLRAMIVIWIIRSHTM